MFEDLFADLWSMRGALFALVLLAFALVPTVIWMTLHHWIWRGLAASQAVLCFGALAAQDKAVRLDVPFDWISWCLTAGFAGIDLFMLAALHREGMRRLRAARAQTNHS